MSNIPTPRKSLGQHWLNDPYVLEAMAEAVDIKKGDTVLEIGPGPGALTEMLLARGAKVVAVEFDEKLAFLLEGKYKNNPNFKLVVQDILKFDLTTLPAGYKVAANIPYYLTSNLLRTLCETSNPFSKASLLIQKEVAERVCAKPGSLSILGVSVQFYCHTGLGPVVPAALFTPPPKVDSQILMLEYRGAMFEDVSPNDYFAAVKAGYSAKRKKLRSSLAGGLRISKPEAEVILGKANVDPNARAQELPLSSWRDIARAISK